MRRTRVRRNERLGTTVTAYSLVALHFCDEQFIPSLLVRDRYDNWKAGGAKRMEERARDRVQEILSTHVPLPLPEKIVKELQAIYESAVATC